MTEPKKLIDLKSHCKGLFSKALYAIFGSAFEKFIGIKDLNEAYQYVQEHPEYGNFFNRAIRAIDFSYEVDERDIKKIPTNCPLAVVSNHPLGGLDGIAMGAMLLGVREDTKVVLNSLLCKMEEIKPWSISVNPFGGAKATAENVGAMKDMIKTLRNGGCVATFPSGTVSYLNVADKCICDPEWNTNIAQIIRRTKATILPVFFEGRNSWFFYLCGLIHPRLRTVLLIREMFLRARKKIPVRIRIGTPISPKQMEEFQTDEELTSWMRLNSYLLGEKAYRQSADKMASAWQIKNISNSIKNIFPPLRPRPLQDLILPIDPQKMSDEIDALPEECCMIKGEKFSVYCAEAWQIKWTLLEIGRLREKTFREVGEGTGKSVDNDEFDQYYLHMFMWDSENKRIVGAYRIGRTDKILQSLGVQGLYASTLFNIQKELIYRISPALEMGRSFIASEYQKKRSTLAILWRGIGEFLSRNPQYKTLYGPVSISTEYNQISKDLMIQFLSEKKTSEELAKFVKAKKPPKVRMNSADKRALLTGVQDIEHISALVSEVELDNKGIPTLLKHYLKLNGELLAFNVDNDFGSCIDGLIMVNMLKTEPKLLKSYMGEKAIEYRAYHGLSTPDLQSKDA